VETLPLGADRQRAIVPTQDGTNVLVNLPNDPQLINILAENNVDISVLPQREEGVWVRAFSSLFFPILLLDCNYCVKQSLNFTENKISI
jgi:cell division protease FtsH